MYCHRCGKLVSEGTSATVNFCPFCGETLKKETAEINSATDQFSYKVDITDKNSMSVEDILYPMIEAEFAKKGFTSQTVHLNGAVRDYEKKKRDNIIVFCIWSAILLPMLLGGPGSIIFTIIGMAINIGAYVLKKKKLQLDNLAYIVSTAKLRPNVPIGQIVAEEMARI